MTSVSDEILDEILALQFLVAWAGEGRCEPPRLGWWDTDLVDELGGGDFFKRLTPRTHAWAALQAAREAARRVEEELRSEAADPDRLRSLFHLGHQLDRQLEDRLRDLKQDTADPAEVLPVLEMLDRSFESEQLASTLQEFGEPDFQKTPGGRRLRGDIPENPLEVARDLAAALVPFDEHYPHPHYRLR